MEKMEKTEKFGGRVLFLDRADINTDEIIPARYLTEISKEALKPHLLEDLKLDGFRPKDLDAYSVIVTRENFGCGSSREHAVWALEVNGITAVIAPSFARIFRQNMFNCGLIAVEVSPEVVESLMRQKDSVAKIRFDLSAGRFTVISGGEEKTFGFAMGEFDRTLVAAGGWVEFADARY